MSQAKKPTPQEKDLCRLITPEFRVSFPHVFKPQAPKPTDKPKYSITMLYPKTSDLTGLAPDRVTKRSLKEVLSNAKNAEFGSKENWPSDLESPVIDGDLPKYADKEGYKGHWVIKATSNEDSKPGLVDSRMMPITVQSDFYPGCYARAFVYARVWEYMGKKGVQFIVDHIQKTRDGDSFGGKKAVDQVFAPIDAPAQSAGDADIPF